MQRAYVSTLDAFAFVYQLQKTNTATGRQSSYVRLVNDLDEIIPAIQIRIDPEVIDETSKTSLIEKGNQCYISVPTEIPILNQGDQLRLLSDTDVEIETYEIKGASDRRSGVTFDRKYRAVRIA